MDLLFAFFLGSLMVVQPTLNRIMLDIKGLSVASLINGAVVFTLAVVAWFFINYRVVNAPSFFHAKINDSFHWWFLLPGLCGFLIIFLSPILIVKLGAFTTVLTMMSGQIIMSLILDATIQGIPISMTRILGLGCALMGAYLSVKPGGIT